MDDIYLKSVWVYLQQELPGLREYIKLEDGKFIITAHQWAMESLHQLVLTTVARIRGQQTDLRFLIRSGEQERDFEVLK